MIKEDTEIRKLTPGQIYDLARILDRESGWKELMSLVPADPSYGSSNCKYSVDDIRMIENASVQQSRSCTEIFFEEWGTSARKRPTVRFLLDLLVKAELFRGADYVAEKLLNEPIPKRPVNGPSSEIAISDSNTAFQASSSMISYCNRDTVVYEEYLEANHQNPNDAADKKINPTYEKLEKEEDGVKYVAFENIRSITNDFDQQVKLGSGAFGSVYLGKMEGMDVAIKVLNADDGDSNLLEHFKNELKILCQHCKHPNILPLLAVSQNKIPCLIYEFMPNGSLESRLACNLKKHSPLNWQKRVCIAKDISEGLRYLHCDFEHPIIHRDIKAANVLLNSEDVAKIGDFGLVRQHQSFKTSSTALIQGTSAYMAPEALKGTISPKMDVFSFGVVLLELLTGLPAYCEERDNGAALVDYVVDVIDNDEDFNNLLDSKGGTWEYSIWNEMYKLSKNCTDGRKKFRPDIKTVNLSLTILKEKCLETNG